MTSKHEAISEALISLRPGAQFVLTGGTLEWHDTRQTQPTDEEIAAEIDRLDKQKAALAYQAARRAEYPPIADFADAWVKNDQAALDAYRARCLAIKAKYPKP